MNKIFWKHNFFSSYLGEDIYKTSVIMCDLIKAYFEISMVLKNNQFLMVLSLRISGNEILLNCVIALLIKMKIGVKHCKIKRDVGKKRVAI